MEMGIMIRIHVPIQPKNIQEIAKKVYRDKALTRTQM
jgi:hypothetical protein